MYLIIQYYINQINYNMMQHLSNCLLAIPINIFLKNFNLKMYVLPTFSIYLFVYFSYGFVFIQ